jgi:hypothetical protein
MNYSSVNDPTTEEIFFFDFIESELQFETPLELMDRTVFQRKKYNLINKLVKDLYDHKNSRDHYSLISNMIILSFTSFEEWFPFDVFTEEEDEFEDLYKDTDCDFKDILRQELYS